MLGVLKSQRLQQGRGPDDIAGRPQLDQQNASLAGPVVCTAIAVDPLFLVRSTGHMAAKMKAIGFVVHLFDFPGSWD
jgi:hypothetical protein